MGPSAGFKRERGGEQGTAALPAVVLRRGGHGGGQRWVEWNKGRTASRHVPAAWPEVDGRRRELPLQRRRAAVLVGVARSCTEFKQLEHSSRPGEEEELREAVAGAGVDRKWVVAAEPSRRSSGGFRGQRPSRPCLGGLGLDLWQDADGGVMLGGAGRRLYL